MGTPNSPQQRKPLSVAIINPRFEPSFWGYDHALPLMPGDKKCWVVTGALPALAALAPAHCAVELFDENVETIDIDDLARFDVIGITGMIVQGARMHELLRLLRPLPAVLIVGGPYVSVAPEIFEGLCDVRFVGEAEETWPAFLDALADGAPIQPRYEQAGKSDMSKVPTPRYDLIKSDRYMMASLQFSRGCPFTCEFCDIITIFGRQPRLKTVAQMMTEFDEIHRAGFRLCFLVDDNLIGNKREAKKLLAALGGWQAAHGYPIQLFAEASLNLAEDAEMIRLMVEANVRQIFIGIESPRKASLAEMKKVQNVRGGTLLSRVQAVRDGGLVVQAGFIVGFDSDDDAIFEDQFAFIQEAGIGQAIIAMLTPIPTTPLYDRLAAAGRLDFGDPDVPFEPALMSRAALRAGYETLVQRLYEPEAYLERIFTGYAGSPKFRARRREVEARGARRRSLWRNAATTLGGMAQAWRLWRRMHAAGHAARLAPAYLAAWRRLNLPLGRERISLSAFVGLCVVHWHFYKVSREAKKHEFGNVYPGSVQPQQVLAA